MKISIICPFYNEEAIIENAIEGMVLALATLNHEWELVLVNDGSLDSSAQLATRVAGKYPSVKVFGYDINRGRGFAIRYGVGCAQGDIVVTTEIDLSWGEDIVHRLVKAFEEHPDADMVVASPNLPGGGYQNVPLKRILFSRLGNRIIRIGHGGNMTMYTGMTRAYRREAFLSVPIDEDEKEFHLEMAQKAQAYGYKIYEIPCVLEWKDHRLAKKGAPKRKSSSKIPKLVRTHMAFAAAAAPFRYILPVSASVSLVSLVFLVLAVFNFLRGQPSVLLLITGLAILLIALVIFSVGVLSFQSMLVQRDIWRLRREIIIMDRHSSVSTEVEKASLAVKLLA